MAFSKIRLSDGRELTVALDGKKVIEALKAVEEAEDESFARFNTPRQGRVWISPQHVAAIEDRPDLE
jgi:hypothetical protein